MAAAPPLSETAGSPSPPPPGPQEEAGLASGPEGLCSAGSRQAPPPASGPSRLSAAAPAAAAPQHPAAAAPGPGGPRPGPETFRRRFRQFRYQDAAGPREAFRQLRELSRQWLRPDVRTKEQIVEMLVREQLLAVLPAAAAARARRRSDVRITG